MRYLFRPIIFGILFGAAVFFIPFHFPFLFFFVFLFIIARIFAPWRRGHLGWRHPGHGYRNDIIPIDGYGNNSNFRSRDNETTITIQ